MTQSPVSTLVAIVRSPRTKPTTRRVGFLAGPLLALLTYLNMPDIEPTGAVLDGNPRAAAVTLALIVLMGVWWMTEVLPLPATALLPAIVFPVFGVAEINDVAQSYSNKVIFLFLGGFVLALAMQRWNVHRHIALRVVLLFGTKPKRLVLGFMLATVLLGMWVSNTATAIMMLSIGASMIAMLRRHGVRDPKLFTSLIVGIAYSASISAFGTIIASPPNALLVGYLSDNYGIKIGFGQWMMFGVPLSLTFLLIGWYILTTFIYPAEVEDVPDGDALVRRELEALGKLTSPQRRVIAIFGATVASWILLPVIVPGTRITDEVIAVIAAVLFFLVPARGISRTPLLTWQDTQELQWGILLLFGGGLALASQITASGLSSWFADQVTGLNSLPTILLVVATCVVTMVLTEFMSNTASAATLIPIMATTGVAVGLSPLALALPTALAAACAFMMPACTPPNAIAVGSKFIRPHELLRAGWPMSLTGIVLITTVTLTLATWVLDLTW